MNLVNVCIPPRGPIGVGLSKTKEKPLWTPNYQESLSKLLNLGDEQPAEQFVEATIAA